MSPVAYPLRTATILNSTWLLLLEGFARNSDIAARHCLSGVDARTADHLESPRFTTEYCNDRAPDR